MIRTLFAQLMNPHHYRCLGKRFVGQPTKVGSWPIERLSQMPSIDRLAGFATGGVPLHS